MPETTQTETAETTLNDFKEYKYGLKREIEKLHPEVRKATREKLQNLCDVSRQTFSMWENLRIGDSRSISADDLALLAQSLNCRIEDLLPVKKFTLYYYGKPIYSNKTNAECIGEKNRLLGTGSYLRSNFEIKPATT